MSTHRNSAIARHVSSAAGITATQAAAAVDAIEGWKVERYRQLCVKNHRTWKEKRELQKLARECLEETDGDCDSAMLRDLRAVLHEHSRETYRVVDPPEVCVYCGMTRAQHPVSPELQCAEFVSEQ